MTTGDPMRTAVKTAVNEWPDPKEGLGIGQLENHLGYFLRRLQIWVFQDFIQTLRPMKVRPAQYSVLLVIERARLARLLHVLERRKWIARRASASDARSHSLYLTKDGEKVLAQIKSLAKQHEAQLAAFIGQRRRQQLLDLLREFG